MLNKKIEFPRRLKKEIYVDKKYVIPVMFSAIAVRLLHSNCGTYENLPPSASVFGHWAARDHILCRAVGDLPALSESP